MIAFITCNSNLVPLLEGLCSWNPCRFEFSIFWVFARIEPTTWASFTSSRMHASANARIAIAQWTSLHTRTHLDACILSWYRSLGRGTDGLSFQVQLGFNEEPSVYTRISEDRACMHLLAGWASGMISWQSPIFCVFYLSMLWIGLDMSKSHMIERARLAW